MTRRQMATLVVLNAAISLLIALGVVWAGLRLGWLAPARQPTPYVIVPPTPTQGPTATPTSTPAPTPTVTTAVYVVEAGDTLLGIALRLKIDPDLLKALNQLDDVDRLFVGQRLLVPADSLPTATPDGGDDLVEATTGEAASAGAGVPGGTPGLSTPSPAVAPTSTPSARGLVILQVVGAGDLETEAIVIDHRGDEDIQMLNWSLVAPDGRRYVFPRFTLRTGSTLRVHSGPGADGVEDLYWSQRQPVWGEGRTVSLRDPAGNEETVFSIGEVQDE